MKNAALGDVSQDKYSTQLCLMLYLSLDMPPCPVFSINNCSSALSNTRSWSSPKFELDQFLVIHKDTLLNYLFENNLLSPNQHGFIPRRSHCIQLQLHVLNNWTLSLDEHLSTDIIYSKHSTVFHILDFYWSFKLIELIKLLNTSL